MQNFGSSVQRLGFLRPAELPVSMASSRCEYFRLGRCPTVAKHGTLAAFTWTTWSPGTFLMTGCRISSCPFRGSRLRRRIHHWFCGKRPRLFQASMSLTPLTFFLHLTTCNNWCWSTKPQHTFSLKPPNKKVFSTTHFWRTMQRYDHFEGFYLVIVYMKFGSVSYNDPCLDFSLKLSQLYYQSILAHLECKKSC